MGGGRKSQRKTRLKNVGHDLVRVNESDNLILCSSGKTYSNEILIRYLMF